MIEVIKVSGKSAPLSVRFTSSEKERLKILAGSKPLGVYIRERALVGEAEPRTAIRNPSQDAEALGQLLALLGQTRISSNLNQLAKAANMGALPVTQETEADIRQACEGIGEMRQLLLKALGMRVFEEVHKTPLPLAKIFNDAAQD